MYNDQDSFTILGPKNGVSTLRYRDSEDSGRQVWMQLPVFD